MLRARTENGELIEATSGANGWCPGCGQKLQPKCGAIMAHHWAHRGKDCDSWAEPESDWHSFWKKQAGPKHSEVVIERDGVRHRADIQTTTGKIIELQNSYLSPHQIAEREHFYGRDNLIWLFNAQNAVQSGRLELRDRKDHFTFRWRHARKSIAYATVKRYLDLGDRGIMRLDFMGKESPIGGKGEIQPVERFLEWLVKQCGGMPIS